MAEANTEEDISTRADDGDEACNAANHNVSISSVMDSSDFQDTSGLNDSVSN